MANTRHTRHKALRLKSCLDKGNKWFIYFEAFNLPSIMDAEAQTGDWTWSGVKLCLAVRCSVLFVLDSLELSD